MTDATIISKLTEIISSNQYTAFTRYRHLALFLHSLDVVFAKGGENNDFISRWLYDFLDQYSNVFLTLGVHILPSNHSANMVYITYDGLIRFFVFREELS